VIKCLTAIGENRRQEIYAALLYDALIGGNIKPISDGQQKIVADKKLLVFLVSEALDIQAYPDYRPRIPLQLSRKTY
jgi:hypothetical protein